MRTHPLVLELPALVFARRQALEHGHEATLAAIPHVTWSGLRAQGFDFVWMMGVWERSPASRRIALALPRLRAAYDRVLPGWTEADVVGSPYAVHDYVLDRQLGAADDLAVLRERLHRAGLGLLVDFVPNHVALDHPWVASHPERFVQADAASARERPEAFFSPDGLHHFAHGRDPYFPPWSDTVQVNFFSESLRAAWRETVLEIAEVADGVRCDMAMLGLNDVFEHTWGPQAGSRPAREFWSETIEAVKQRHPRFLFVAEAYWGLEPALLELGFDQTYDKDLYDRLRQRDARAVREGLGTRLTTSGHAVHFVENHDEARALEAFGREPSLTAAVLAVTLPGMRLVWDGQLEGRRVQAPVQLARWPDEPPDPEIAAAYENLLAFADDPVLHEGRWSPLETLAWPDRGGAEGLLAWEWRHEDGLRVVVVNFSERPARDTVRLPALGDARTIAWIDRASDARGAFAARELEAEGLDLALAPWGFRLLELNPG